MKLGMPTLIENENIEQNAELCKRLDLDFIEINMNLPQYQADKINIRQFKEVAKFYNIEYTFHADENMNPFDFNKRISVAYTDTMIETINLAKELDASLINMHMPNGVYFTLPNEKIYLFEKYEEEFYKKIKDFKNTIEQKLNNDSLKICIENCGKYEEFQSKGLGQLLTSPYFYLTYDIGHAAYAETKMREYFNSNKSKLTHMHIHDAKVKNDKCSNHLILGSGHLDLNYYFNLAKERNCSVVLETKTVDGLTRSVKWLKSNKIIDK